MRKQTLDQLILELQNLRAQGWAGGTPVKAQVHAKFPCPITHVYGFWPPYDKIHTKTETHINIVDYR